MSNTGLRAGASVGTGVATETFKVSTIMKGVGITVGICVGNAMLETMAPVKSGIKVPPVITNNNVEERFIGIVEVVFPQKPLLSSHLIYL